MSKCYDDPDIEGEVNDIKEHLENIRRWAPKCAYDVNQIVEILDDLVTVTAGETPEDHTESEVFFGDIIKGDLIEFRTRLKVVNKSMYSAGPVVYGYDVRADGTVSTKYTEYPFPRSEDDRKTYPDRYLRRAYMVEKAKTPEEQLKEDIIKAGYFPYYMDDLDRAVAHLKSIGWTFDKKES